MKLSKKREKFQQTFLKGSNNSHRITADNQLLVHSVNNDFV